MIEFVNKWREEHKAEFKISVELEKPRSDQLILIECASVFADIIFIGKDFAQFRGFKSMQETIDNIKSTLKPR